MQQFTPQVYLKYNVVAINFLAADSENGVYQKRTVYVSETNCFVYMG
jgi:hypothetical protein